MSTATANRRPAWPIAAALLAMLVGGAGGFMAYGPGSDFLRQMAAHVLLMSLAAPLLVWAFAARNRQGRSGGLVAATLAQLALLYFWHLPAGHALMSASPLSRAFMHASLALVAVWFWYAVTCRCTDERWPAIVALLVTGKLFCLLGVLFVFAPGPLFSMASGALVPIEAQQAAGLLMLGACPLTYLGAALYFTCRMVIWPDERPADGFWQP